MMICSTFNNNGGKVIFIGGGKTWIVLTAFTVSLLHPSPFLLCLSPVFCTFALQGAIGPVGDLLNTAAEVDHLLLDGELQQPLQGYHHLSGGRGMMSQKWFHQFRSLLEVQADMINQPVVKQHRCLRMALCTVNSFQGREDCLCSEGDCFDPVQHLGWEDAQGQPELNRGAK